jgi:uncharacterized protein YprB with RNaseH-like and TPR domain
VKEDLRERLKRLNKGRLADQLVSGRELAHRDKEAKGKSSNAQSGEEPKKKTQKSRSGQGRRRLREDMIRPAKSRSEALDSAGGESDGPPRPDQTPPQAGGGLGSLAGLRKRLKGETSGTTVSSGGTAAFYPRTDRRDYVHDGLEELREAIDGELCRTELGCCLKRTTILPAGGWYGPQQTPEPDEIDPAVVARVSRDGRFESLTPGDFLFLDTETTGLAGGTGTLAFMVGVGFWQEGSLQVIQYFMPDYPEEQALLSLLEQDVGGYSSLVTFNGKSFDVPLLSSRFVSIRSEMASRMCSLPHLDLIHPSRRLWKRRVGDCSLTNLEAQILGFEREEDIPGWEIPQAYFRFVTDGDPGPLPTVFLHNQFDLVTLAQLAAKMCRLYREPLGDRKLPGLDLYSLARSLEMDGSPQTAVEVLEEARTADLDTETRRTLLRHLSKAYKRGKNWEGAVEIWQELGEFEGTLEVFSFEEMAKFYEHVACDLRMAEAVVRRVLDALSGDGYLDPVPYQDPDQVEAAFRHRLVRIERKMAKQKHHTKRKGTES